MRKIIVSNMVSVDGYFAGPHGDISWHTVDDEFNQYAIAMLENSGLLVFGRITYDLMASYWTIPQAPVEEPPAIADSMNNLPKVVFSKSMEKAGWNNTKVVKEINTEEVESWQKEEGKDIIILGSGTIVQQFAKLGLIDEYRLIIVPVVLGSGKPLFIDRIELELESSRTFENGNVMVIYSPVKGH